MKTYIRNIDELNEMLGYSDNGLTGEEIGYGERALIFRDVTDICEGKTKAEKLDDFLKNGEMGQSFRFRNKQLCKVRNSSGDAVVVYEDKNFIIHEF